MTRHGELGTALHRWRDRTVPAEAGLPVGEPRPGQGLRREELARLTGLSVDYIVRLEQGRATSPSVEVLRALARALRLSDDERRHLYLLAGQPPPATAHVSTHIPPSAQRLLDRLAGAPLSVYDASWNLLTWNPPWAALIGDPAQRSGRERNVAWQHFAGMPSRVAHTLEQEARFEAAIVTDLRSATTRYPTDVKLRLLIAELRRISVRFVGLWNSRLVGFHDSDSTTVHHPDVGVVTVDRDTFTLPAGDLRVVVCSAAPGSADADKLSVLDVIGGGTAPEGSEESGAPGPDPGGHGAGDPAAADR